MQKKKIAKILVEAKRLAKRYKDLTGRPLGITGEVAEFTAATKLKLKLAGARQAGYDAIRCEGGKEVKIQIKGRCLPRNYKSGQRLGSIRLDKEWDSVLMVLLDEVMEPLEIYEAGRKEITKALKAPGSRARNERGALSVSKFKKIGDKVWDNKA